MGSEVSSCGQAFSIAYQSLTCGQELRNSRESWEESLKKRLLFSWKKLQKTKYKTKQNQTSKETIWVKVEAMDSIKYEEKNEGY